MSIWKWIAGIFTSVKNDAAKIAVSVTEGIQTVLKTGILKPVAELIDASLHTHLGEDALALLDANITKILAVELAIVGLPDNPTPADIEDFSNRVCQAIAGKNLAGNSKLWTTLAAQVYGIIETEVNKHEPVTFATLVADVELAYQDYKADLVAINNDTEAAASAENHTPVADVTPAPVAEDATEVVTSTSTENPA